MADAMKPVEAWVVIDNHGNLKSADLSGNWMLGAAETPYIYVSGPDKPPRIIVYGDCRLARARIVFESCARGAP